MHFIHFLLGYITRNYIENCVDFYFRKFQIFFRIDVMSYCVKGNQINSLLFNVHTDLG